MARRNPEFRGRAGAGMLFTCEDDNTVFLMHRSRYVEQPGTWGLPDPALTVRSNPYSQTNYEGYLINPNPWRGEDETIWWHWSKDRIAEFYRGVDAPYTTYLASTPQILDHIAGGVLNGYLYRVRVKPKKSVRILERDDIFEKLSPFLKRQLESMKKMYGLEDDIQYMTEYDAALAESEYPDIFRHFSTFSCMREPFKSVFEEQNLAPDTLDIFRFSVSAYLEGFEAVQAFFFRDLRDVGVSNLDTRMPGLLGDMGFHGWFERESFGADINIGIDLKYYDVTILSEKELDDECSVEGEYTYRPNPVSEVVAARGYLVNPHALDEDGHFEWYHRSYNNDLMFERMEDSGSNFPAFYLSSTASSVIDLGGSYNDTLYVINIKDGKYLDIQHITKGELEDIRDCLTHTLEGRGIPRQDAIYLADYQLKMFKKSEMWYWMESVPVPSADVEMTVDYVSVISTIEGTKVKVPGSRRTYIFYRGYPNWNYPAVFIDCLKSLGYNGWFETQDSTVLPQITVALLNPMETAERNFEYPLHYAESLIERGHLP